MNGSRKPSAIGTFAAPLDAAAISANMWQSGTERTGSMPAFQNGVALQQCTNP